MNTPFIGVSPEIQKIRETIDAISIDAALNVIITGETGVGKEVVARTLYESSPRKKKGFIKVNCAAIPETLLESELFGVEQGAYTGANKKRRGKFELADGGVLFLDEIGDIPFPLQAKLLHVLQSGEYNRLGSETNIKSDTWVISATNHNLREKIHRQEFRKDLYYRLNMFQIDIPPLRKRPKDIPELINHYTKTYKKKYSHREINDIDTPTFNRLCSFSWPGNVRQLISILHRIFLMGCDGDTLDEILYDPPCPTTHHSDTATSIHGQLMDEIRHFAINTPNDMTTFSLKEIKKNATDIVEKEVISQVLTTTNWNRTHASKILKISYKTLLTKIGQLDIQRPGY